MISKIIQKEKERQERYLNGCGSSVGIDSGKSCPIKHKDFTTYCYTCSTMHEEHKQSLINLKEYMEELLTPIPGGINFDIVTKIKEDIKELTKIIEKYK